jgi:hypothetical protein
MQNIVCLFHAAQTWIDMITLLINATEKTGPTIITAVIITIICITVLVLNFYVLKVCTK